MAGNASSSSTRPTSPISARSARSAIGGTQGSANYSPVNVNGLGYSHNDVATVQANVNWTGQNWTDSAALVEGQNYLKIQNLAVLSITGLFASLKLLPRI